MEFYYFITGLTLGIIAGIMPGPLMALLISETVKGNLKNGVLISITPAITDIPIILLFLFFYGQIQNLNIIIKTTSILGSFILFYYGFKDLFINKVNIKLEENKTNSLKKGIILNILNPHAYMFWGFVGVPLVLKASIIGKILFILSFFIGISSSMFLISLATAKSKNFLKSKYYIYIIKTSGAFLIVFGIYLFLNYFKHSI